MAFFVLRNLDTFEYIIVDEPSLAAVKQRWVDDTLSATRYELATERPFATWDDADAFIWGQDTQAADTRTGSVKPDAPVSHDVKNLISGPAEELTHRKKQAAKAKAKNAMAPTEASSEKDGASKGKVEGEYDGKPKRERKTDAKAKAEAREAPKIKPADAPDHEIGASLKGKGKKPTKKAQAVKDVLAEAGKLGGDEDAQRLVKKNEDKLGSSRRVEPSEMPNRVTSTPQSPHASGIFESPLGKLGDLTETPNRFVIPKEATPALVGSSVLHATEGQGVIVAAKGDRVVVRFGQHADTYEFTTKTLFNEKFFPAAANETLQRLRFGLIEDNRPKPVGRPDLPSATAPIPKPGPSDAETQRTFSRVIKPSEQSRVAAPNRFDQKSLEGRTLTHRKHGKGTIQKVSENQAVIEYSGGKHERVALKALQDTAVYQIHQAQKAVSVRTDYKPTVTLGGVGADTRKLFPDIADKNKLYDPNRLLPGIEALEKQLIQRAKTARVNVVVGATPGYDFMLAAAAIRARDAGADVRLTVAVSHRGKSSRWPEHSATYQWYERILGRADEIHYVSDPIRDTNPDGSRKSKKQLGREYAMAEDRARRYIIQSSDEVIALWNRETRTTAPDFDEVTSKSLVYAQQKGVTITNVYDDVQDAFQRAAPEVEPARPLQRAKRTGPGSTFNLPETSRTAAPGEQSGSRTAAPSGRVGVTGSEASSELTTNRTDLVRRQTLNQIDTHSGRRTIYNDLVYEVLKDRMYFSEGDARRLVAIMNQRAASTVQQLTASEADDLTTAKKIAHQVMRERYGVTYEPQPEHRLTPGKNYDQPVPSVFDRRWEPEDYRANNTDFADVNPRQSYRNQTFQTPQEAKLFMRLIGTGEYLEPKGIPTVRYRTDTNRQADLMLNPVAEMDDRKFYTQGAVDTYLARKSQQASMIRPVSHQGKDVRDLRGTERGVDGDGFMGLDSLAEGQANPDRMLIQQIEVITHEDRTRVPGPQKRMVQREIFFSTYNEALDFVRSRRGLEHWIDNGRPGIPVRVTPTGQTQILMLEGLKKSPEEYHNALTQELHDALGLEPDKTTAPTARKKIWVDIDSAPAQEFIKWYNDFEGVVKVQKGAAYRVRYKEIEVIHPSENLPRSAVKRFTVSQVGQISFKMPANKLYTGPEGPVSLEESQQVWKQISSSALKAVRGLRPTSQPIEVPAPPDSDRVVRLIQLHEATHVERMPGVPDPDTHAGSRARARGEVLAWRLIQSRKKQLDQAWNPRRPATMPEPEVPPPPPPKPRTERIEIQRPHVEPIRDDEPRPIQRTARMTPSEALQAVERQRAKRKARTAAPVPSRTAEMVQDGLSSGTAKPAPKQGAFTATTALIVHPTANNPQQTLAMQLHPTAAYPEPRTNTVQAPPQVTSQAPPQVTSQAPPLVTSQAQPLRSASVFERRVNLLTGGLPRMATGRLAQGLIGLAIANAIMPSQKTDDAFLAGAEGTARNMGTMSPVGEARHLRTTLSQESIHETERGLVTLGAGLVLAPLAAYATERTVTRRVGPASGRLAGGLVGIATWAAVGVVAPIFLKLKDNAQRQMVASRDWGMGHGPDNALTFQESAAEGFQLEFADEDGEMLDIDYETDDFTDIEEVEDESGNPIPFDTSFKDNPFIGHVGPG